MVRPGDTALHAAVRDSAGCTLEKISSILEDAGCEGSRLALVNAKNAEGMTPLMIAAAGGGGHGLQSAARMAAVARFLLANGAAATVTSHSWSRRDAADYAQEHGKPRLAEEIRAVQREMIRAAGQDQVTPVPRETLHSRQHLVSFLSEQPSPLPPSTTAPLLMSPLVSQAGLGLWGALDRCYLSICIT